MLVHITDMDSARAPFSESEHVACTAGHYAEPEHVLRVLLQRAGGKGWGRLLQVAVPWRLPGEPGRQLAVGAAWSSRCAPGERPSLRLCVSLCFRVSLAFSLSLSLARSLALS